MIAGGWPAALGLMTAALAATGGLALGIVGPEAAGAVALGVAAVVGAGDRVAGAVAGLPVGVGVAIGALTVRALLLPATDEWLAVGVGLAVAAAALVGLLVPPLPLWSLLAGVGAVLAVPGALGAQPPDGEVALAVVLAAGWGAASGALGATVALLLTRAAGRGPSDEDTGQDDDEADEADDVQALTPPQATTEPEGDDRAPDHHAPAAPAPNRHRSVPPTPEPSAR